MLGESFFLIARLKIMDRSSGQIWNYWNLYKYNHLAEQNFESDKADDTTLFSSRVRPCASFRLMFTGFPCYRSFNFQLEFSYWLNCFKCILLYNSCLVHVKLLLNRIDFNSSWQLASISLLNPHQQGMSSILSPWP